VERFRTLTRNYYRNAHAAVFVYSVAEASSLHYLSQWIKDTQNFAPSATRMLLGNKTDIEPMEIDELTSKSFAKAHEFDLHFHISCKSNSGIMEAFDKLASALHKSGANSKPALPHSPKLLDSDNSKVQLDAEPQQASRCAC